MHCNIFCRQQKDRIMETELVKIDFEASETFNDTKINELNKIVLDLAKFATAISANIMECIFRIDGTRNEFNFNFTSTEENVQLVSNMLPGMITEAQFVCETLYKIGYKFKNNLQVITIEKW